MGFAWGGFFGVCAGVGELCFITKKLFKRANTRDSIGRGEAGYIERKRYAPIQDGGGLQLLNKTNNYATLCPVVSVGV